MSEYRVAPAEGPYTNRLIESASPYLVQHAHNPVDWYEWGPEALERARAEDKPILVSVGYAACHWCHVMAHESFEDPATAALMNELFVCIKVDREERPDIDSVYMTAVQAMTGQGGWPMNAFCLPDGTPFYGGTYFPPESKARRYNMASWPQVLHSVAEAYRTRRPEIVESGRELVAHMNRIAEAPTNNMFNFPPVRELITSAIDQLSLQYDAAEGGFGGAPKFPQPMTLEFLLRAHLRDDERALPMLTHTLRKMAWGGIYDQVGGGFHRYSVDARWLVPHFEKMLYDNGLLARLYVEAYQVTGEPLFQRIAIETLDYILREMRHPQGGFYSTQDADSLPYPGADHAEEGAFYVWTPDEVREHLGEDAMLFGQLFDVTRQGNFEGRTILNLPRDPAAVARVTGASPERLQAVIDRGRTKLYAARARRPAPFRDEKIIIAWNGMTIRALVAAALAFERPDYLAAAQQCTDFILTQMRRPDGRLLRSWKDGRPGPLGFLEDYAQLLDALLALHAADGDARWLREAKQTAESTLALFWDAQAGVLYDTATDQEALVTRPRDIGDNAVPSGTSVAVEAFLRLTALTGEDVYRDRARKLLNGLGPMMIRFPQGFGRLLCAADLYSATIVELALVGEANAEDTQALLKTALGSYRPHLVVARTTPGNAEAASLTPLLEQRDMIDGKATAYVCRKFVCELPVTEAEALESRLERQ